MPTLRHCESADDLHGTVKIGYEVHNGDAAASWVVFVAGVAAPRGMWDRQVAALAPTTGAVTVDNRGIGDSDVPAGGYSTEAMAADVLTVVADVVPAGAPVHIVGHSLGAMISCKVAGVLAAEKRLASLTLLSGSLGGWFNMIPPITAKLFRTLPKLATASTAHRRASADLDCHYTDAYVAEHRDDLMDEYVNLSNSQKRFDEGRQRAKTGEDGHLAAVFKHRVTAADLAAVRDSGARVVVAHGRHDFVAGVSAGETLWRAFKDAGCAVADYHVLHGAHFIQREREIEINGLVNAQVAGGAIDAPPVAAEAPPNFGCYAVLFFLACLAVLLVLAFSTDALPKPRSLQEIPEFLASDANATWAALWNQTDEADELLSAFIFRGAPRAGAAALRLATA